MTDGRLFIASMLLAVSIDSVLSGLVGALVAGVPAVILWVRERNKDRAVIAQIETETDIDALTMVRELLDDKAALIRELADLRRDVP
jgi:hypothetical protein